MGTPACWRKSLGSVQVAPLQVPVENGDEEYRPCCRSGDGYKGHGICMSVKAKKGGSGYYVAGCTDPKVEADVCRRSCAVLKRLDVTYDADSALWKCCGGNSKGPTCGNPSQYSFSAPDPLSLDSAPTKSVPIAAEPVQTNNATQSNRASSDELKQSTEKLSGGVIGGIIVSVILLVALIALAVWFVLKQRRRRKDAEATLPLKIPPAGRISPTEFDQPPPFEPPPFEERKVGYYGHVDDTYTISIPTKSNTVSRKGEWYTDMRLSGPQELYAGNAASELGAREIATSPTRDQSGVPMVRGKDLEAREKATSPTKDQSSMPIVRSDMSRDWSTISNLSTW